MSVSSPLRSVHEEHEATFMPYGDESLRAEVVEAFASLGGEYAAIRKAAGVIDLPQRGTIRVRGGDRIEFLNRMLTQELKDLGVGRVRRSFWLNRKGRIDADLRVIAREDELVFDCEILSVTRAIEGLSAYLFAEDVELIDAAESMHRIAVHGPRAWEAVSSVSDGDRETIEPGTAWELRIDGVEVLIDRHDTTGEIGLEMLVAAEDAERVYRAIMSMDGVTPIGWHAYNIARVEAGVPIFGIDFGPSNLPHETGVLRDRVSFKKGCYLGQEVVARMESLGHPKQIIVGLRVDDGEGADHPATGSAVMSGEKTVGAISSCTRSPMLGDAIIALAPVKWDASKPGTEVRVEFASGQFGRAVVQESLTFWRHAATTGGTGA